jgi:hypothetical protein
LRRAVAGVGAANRAVVLAVPTWRGYHRPVRRYAVLVAAAVAVAGCAGGGGGGSVVADAGDGTTPGNPAPPDLTGAVTGRWTCGTVTVTRTFPDSTDCNAAASYCLFESADAGCTAKLGEHQLCTQCAPAEEGVAFSAITCQCAP